MKKILIAVIGVLLLIPTAFADDAFIGGVGGNIEIQESQDIQMLEEIIRIDVYPSSEDDPGVFDYTDFNYLKNSYGFIEYEIWYTFRNTSDESQTVRMGFPELCDWYCEGEFRTNAFQELVTEQKIDGKWVPIERTFVPVTDESTESINWYLADVTLPPGDTEIRNNYWVLPGAYREGQRWLSYMIQTGSSWKDVIEDVQIELIFHDGMTVYSAYNAEPAGYLIDLENEMLTWHFENLEPTEEHNISVGYLDPYEKDFFCEDISEDSEDQASSSLEPFSETVTFYPCKAHDSDTTTAWVEGVDGPGEGETIEIPHRTGHNIEKVKIFNGYGVSKELWQENGRVAELELSFSTGDIKTIKVEDIFGYQIIDLDSPIIFPQRYVKRGTIVKIKSSYPGDKFEDTAISEIQFLGLLSDAQVEAPPYEEEIVAEESVEAEEAEERSKSLDYLLAAVPIVILVAALAAFFGWRKSRT